jgi:hypothetical protein
LGEIIGTMDAAFKIFSVLYLPFLKTNQLEKENYLGKTLIKALLISAFLGHELDVHPVKLNIDNSKAGK